MTDAKKEATAEARISSVRATDKTARSRFSQSVFIALKILFSVGLLGYFASRTKVDLTGLLRADLHYLCTALGLLVIQHILGGLRWRVVLLAFGSSLRRGRAIAVHFISCVFNLVLPASAGGDFVRVWYARGNAIPVESAVRSVVADRLVALLVLLGMILLGQPFATRFIHEATALSALRLIGLAAITGTALLLTGERILQPWQRHRWVRILYWPSQLARRILLNGPVCWRAVSLSFGIHCITCLSVGLIALAYGISLPLAALFLLVPPVILALGLPVSIGGWGMREAAMVAALSGIGIAPNTAFLIAVTLGLLSGASTLPGLIFWVCYRSGQTGPQVL